MSATTLARPVPGGAVGRLLARAATRLADAEAEYDAALDGGATMVALVRLDQEVAAATRAHHDALRAAAAV